MFVRTSRPLAALVLSLLTAAASARAVGVLEHVPENALGFAAVKNIGAASAKIEKLGQIFAKVSPTPLPAPLMLIKAATGLGEGLDEAGDALLVALPGDGGAAEPRPLFVAPVADYAKFAAALSGDAAGEICRVTIAGQEVLLARRGGYALLMNVEDRPALEAFVTAEPKALPHVTELTDWMAENDASLVLLPLGVAKLTEAGNKFVGEVKTELEAANVDPEVAREAERFRDVIEAYDASLGFLDAEIEAAAIGLSIDDATNVRMRVRVLVKDGGTLAKTFAGKREQAEPLAGIPSGDFVLAGGGPLPPNLSESMKGVSRHFFEEFMKLYGFEQFGGDDWRQLEKLWAKITVGVKSISFVILPGQGDEPIYSNFFGVAKVGDSKDYVSALRESTELWDKLMSRSTSDLNALQHKFSDATVAGKPALLLTVDLAELIDDPDVPMLKEFMTQMFGAVVRTYIVAADEHTVVMGVAGEERMKAIVSSAVATEVRLFEASRVQPTDALLDKESTTRMFVSPRGFFLWGTRMLRVFSDKLGGPAPNYPDYPDGPPIGCSLRTTAEHVGIEMVWPSETLKGLADFTEACNKLDAGG